MEQAGIHSDVIQLCYLQKDGIMPNEYTRLCTDCSTMTEAWSRLEERVPTEIIRQEVINKFKSMKPLTQICLPVKLRDFANELSLFCRRMEDLNLVEESNSVIVLQQVYEKMDSEIVRRFRSELKLSNRFGSKIGEDLGSLAEFLRSEAITLELSGPLKKPYNNHINSQDSLSNTDSVNFIAKSKTDTGCELGCLSKHCLSECPIYLNYPVGKRKNYIKNNPRCYICLYKNHFVKDCRNLKACSICSGTNHHWSLCPRDEEKSDKSNYSTMSETCPGNLAPCIVVEVLAMDGSWHHATCLLDTGSNTSLVRNDFFEMLGLDGFGGRSIQFGTAGGRFHNEYSQEVELQIRPLKGDNSYKIFALGIKKPCFPIKPIHYDIFEENPHLDMVKDDIFMNGGTVDLLLGMDYAPLILPEKVIKAPHEPDKHVSAAYTRLGYYLFGGLDYKHSSDYTTLVSHFICYEENEFELKQYFYGDILGVKPTSLCTCSDSKIEESMFIKHVQNTTTFNSEGRVCVRMPWKPGYPQNLPNNYNKALHLMEKRERQLVKLEKLNEYNCEISDLVKRGVIREIENDGSPGWYLNHRMVERPESESTKLRLVFDSSLPYKGVCLNDTLEKGPNYTNSLLKCLIHWRMNYIAVTGDIEKMFHQIAMVESDQIYHRFLWRFGDMDSKPRIFQWLRLIFGDKPSPDLANFALRFIADKSCNILPEGARVLRDSTYVDDVGSSYSDLNQALNATHEIDSILETGKFKIKIWNSNHREVDCTDKEMGQYLGHIWNKWNDMFGISFTSPSNQPIYFTKRSVMGIVSKIWDPFGIVLPVTMKYKIGLQNLWQLGFGWDDCLPDKFQVLWTGYHEELKLLENYMIDRCVKPLNTIGKPQMHCFSDGGDDGFGTCIFLRWETSSGIEVKFVAAKAFVAPLKRKTIPRLELMGVVTMSRLAHSVMESLEIELQCKTFWIDSQVVLFWLQSESNRFKAFVSSRIQECKDTHPEILNEIRYIPSKLNHADPLTKPIQIHKLKTWHAGPDFLRESPHFYLKTFHNDLSKCKTELDHSLLELKVHNVTTGHTVHTEDSMESILCKQMSSWFSIVKVVVLLLEILKSKSFKIISDVKIFTPLQISNAERLLFKLSQKSLLQDFNEVHKRFKKYDLKVDDEGLIRAGGRLTRTNLSSELKYPILLDGKSCLVHKFAKEKHHKLLHQGYRVILCHIYDLGFFIVNGKNLLKNIASKCIFCKIRQRALCEQKMGDLPSFRAEVNCAPFLYVALDFFGYFKVKLSRNCGLDASVLIITCTTTRCIHLELCASIDTNSFLRAWRRFVSTRGVHPVKLFSDCASTFKSANNELIKWIKQWDLIHIKNTLAQNSTQVEFNWKFNIPKASHMNGVVESLIRSVRKGLDAAVYQYTSTRLSFDEWFTVLAEINYIVNSRPLYPDGDDFSCITGNKLLFPYGQSMVPQTVQEPLSNFKDLLKVGQAKVNLFWEHWLKNFPAQLLTRSKWFVTHRNLKVGDFVINLDTGVNGRCLPRAMWKKAIVSEAHESEDGLVRSVTIRDANHKFYKRPINKLCLIATCDELNGIEG